jgi:hypothetical protein
MALYSAIAATAAATPTTTTATDEVAIITETTTMRMDGCHVVYIYTPCVCDLDGLHITTIMCVDVLHMFLSWVLYKFYWMIWYRYDYCHVGNDVTHSTRVSQSVTHHQPPTTNNNTKIKIVTHYL